MLQQDMERRLYKRIPREVKVRYLIPAKTFDQVYSAFTYDVGYGGIGLEMDSPIEEGSDILVELIPRDYGLDQEVIRILAKGIWCVTKEGKYRVGILFLFSGRHLQARVARFVDGLDHLVSIGA